MNSRSPIKAAFLLEDQGFEHMDLSRPEEGNPGVGGTAYCFLLAGRYLAKEDTVSVTYYHFRDNVLPEGGAVLAEDLSDALKRVKKDDMDILILKNLQDMSIYRQIEDMGLRCVVWAHNFLTYEEICFFRTSNAVCRVICVGRQMYDYYLDDPVISKMDYIFNIFQPPEKEIPRKTEYDLNVTYIGSLVYEKNFHVLASAWKDIAASVPEAKLHVIGSGRLYSREQTLGEYGVASKEYEDIFIPQLLDESGKLMDSVTFHGLLGDEKYEIFSDTAVGVVNPMAATETFCLCAIEMESCGIPVVSRRKNGLLDTVLDRETGLLYKDSRQLADHVIGLLRDREKNIRLGGQAREYAHTAFLPEKILPEWKRVLEEVYEDRPAPFHKPKNCFDNNGKWLRYGIHGLRCLPFLKKIPSIHDIQKK